MEDSNISIGYLPVTPKQKLPGFFLPIPNKDYRNSRYHFVKNYLLHLKNQSVEEKRYVKNIPRDIR